MRKVKNNPNYNKYKTENMYTCLFITIVCF
jgi:hypothetical protein